MNEPRRHHYLPKFYLSSFAEKDRLWVFDRGSKEYRRQTPRDTAVERDYYTVIDNAGKENRDFERILSDIEGKASAAIRHIDERKDISEDDRAAVAVFVALLKVRVPDFEKTFAELGNKIFKQWLKVDISSEKRAATIKVDYERDTGKPLPLSPKELMDFAQSGVFIMEPHRNQTISVMIEMSAELALLLVQMDWVFVHAPDQSTFVTSDVPFGIIPPRTADPQGWYGIGVLTPGAVKYVPLTRSTALMMFGEGNVTRHTDSISQDHVRELNLGITARTDRFAISHDRALLENLVSTTGIDRTDRGPRISIT